MVDGKDGRERTLDVAALKAFSHPLRMAMYDVLKDDGPQTASMLARLLGESTGQTSYHLRQMERHGLIEEDPERGSGRERWWRPLGLHFGAEDALTRDAGRVVLQHWADAQFAHLREWLARIPSEDLSWVQNSLHSESTVKLTREELSDLGDAVVEVVTQHVRAAKERVRTEGDELRTVKIYAQLFPLPAGEQPEHDAE